MSGDRQFVLKEAYQVGHVAAGVAFPKEQPHSGAQSVQLALDDRHAAGIEHFEFPRVLRREGDGQLVLRELRGLAIGGAEMDQGIDALDP